MAQGLWLMPQGPWPKAHGHQETGARARALGDPAKVVAVAKTKNPKNPSEYHQVRFFENVTQFVIDFCWCLGVSKDK